MTIPDSLTHVQWSGRDQSQRASTVQGEGRRSAGAAGPEARRLRRKILGGARAPRAGGPSIFLQASGVPQGRAVTADRRPVAPRKSLGLQARPVRLETPKPARARNRVPEKPRLRSSVLRRESSGPSFRYGQEGRLLLTADRGRQLHPEPNNAGDGLRRFRSSFSSIHICYDRSRHSEMQGRERTAAASASCRRPVLFVAAV